MPLRNPFAEILPNGPASNTAGGRLAMGPVMAGVDSGPGGGGSAGLAAWSGVAAAGASWAAHTEASASPSAQILIVCSLLNRIVLLRNVGCVVPLRRERRQV